MDTLTAASIHGLVTERVAESFDLDYKATLYGMSDSAKRDLAGDVAALANTAGGVILLGVQVDEQAQATAAPGVDVCDDEVRRIRLIVASLVAPMPDFDVVPVIDPTTSEAAGASSQGQGDGSTQASGTGDGAAASGAARGFLVIAVPRSPSAPHAVIVNEGLRYPRRNGATTRYLSEPEVAAAYRDRFAGAARQGERLVVVDREAHARVHLEGESPWLLVTLVPDLPGDIIVNAASLRQFQSDVVRSPVFDGYRGLDFRRASAGPRRLRAQGNMDNSALADDSLLEVHTDGSGAFAVRLPDIARRQSGQQVDQSHPVMVNDEVLAAGLFSGVRRLATEARDRAAAGGNALIRARLIPAAEREGIELGHFCRRVGGGYNTSFGETRGTALQPEATAVAEVLVMLDDVAQQGAPLVAASAALADELAQCFGVAEMGQFSRDGELRRRNWVDAERNPFVAWARAAGIAISDESLQPPG